MEAHTVERKLSAIFAADVEGYSRLMGRDEVGTLRNLTAYRAIIDRLIASHRGRIFNTAGDSLVADFASAVDAVQCAVEIQHALAKENEGRPAGEQMRFRIGVHVGHIMVQGDNLFGDAVNVAARLEALAEPGGICVSGVARDHIGTKLPVGFFDLGPQQVKNIAQPIRAYRVRVETSLTATPVLRGSLPLPDRPSIAVLPFANMSGDPEQEYFADGTVEEIITALSRIRWLFVIARNSSFTYKGQAVDVKQIGRELGVRYVLEGSVRKAGQRVRITGQLIDTITGTHLWADRFDGSIEDIFELQDKVALSVAGVIEPTLQAAEIRRSVARPTTDLGAYDLYLRALAAFYPITQQGMVEALGLFDQAIAIDGHYGPALAWAANCHLTLVRDGWAEEPKTSRRKASDLARRALQVAQNDPRILVNAAQVLALFGEDISAMIGLVDRALALNPSYAHGWFVSGLLRIFAGQHDLAIEHVETSLRLSPRERMGTPLSLMGLAYFFNRRFDEAAAKLLLALQDNPGHPPAYRTLEKLMGCDDIPNTHVLIRGPQGCGKSTKTMTKIPIIHENHPGVIFFSSPSIQQAEEKIETFERINKDERFVPYLYLSLTALYERFCPSSDRLDHIDIWEEGGSSWLHAVFERQRDVYETMFNYRCRLLDLRAEGKFPVLFGTHETVRQHVAAGMTRLFYSPGFSEKWFATMSLQERENWRNHLLGQNWIYRVIVDEVTAHDLVSLHTAEIAEWVQRCATETGFSRIFDIAERYTKFGAYLAEHPCKDITWNLILEVLKCEYTDEHIVEVCGREVPLDDKDGIYAKMVGQRYYVRSRGWWNEFRVVTMLTTEAVPTRIIEAIDKESASQGELQDDRFKVYDFGLPDSARDTVTIELQRACKKESLDQLVRAYHEEYPHAEIIADMVKNRISEFTVTTHMSAKGSNSYIGSDILSFYNALSPALFGELGALNTRFNRSDLVRLFYTDRFEQTCGRNRGFRGEQGHDHRAVFPPRLYSWLAPAMSTASYVGVQAKPSVTLNLHTDESN